jgi:hypothetical protein
MGLVHEQPHGRIDALILVHPRRTSHNSPMMMRDRARQAARANRAHLRRLGKTGFS